MNFMLSIIESSFTHPLLAGFIAGLAPVVVFVACAMILGVLFSLEDLCAYIYEKWHKVD
jgi:hypothetical protein